MTPPNLRQQVLAAQAGCGKEGEFHLHFVLVSCQTQHSLAGTGLQETWFKLQRSMQDSANSDLRR
jgi:hypothetical protein